MVFTVVSTQVKAGMRSSQRLRRSWNKSRQRDVTGLGKPDRTAWPQPITQHWHQSLLEASSSSAPFAELKTFIAGVEMYRGHHYYRPQPRVNCVWQKGRVRLWDYGTCPQAAPKHQGTVLLIPSLINRSSIFDLHPQHSFARWLSVQGFQPLLIDWGEFSSQDQTEDLETYYKNVVLEIAQGIEDVNLHALGYCMGGIFAVTLARDLPQLRSLTTLGTSWDFANMPLVRMMQAEHVSDALNAMQYFFGGVPMIALQSLFATVDSRAGFEKFQRFSQMNLNSFEAQHFIAVEDWLNQDTIVSASVMRTIWAEFVQNNALRKKTFQINGAPLKASQIPVPSLIVGAVRDKIAPLPSVEPLARDLANSAFLRVQTGHIGMMAGRNAPNTVWSPIARFMKQCEGNQGRVQSNQQQDIRAKIPLSA
jgi:polyhydroxyalkanoate synthase subunit PhaC